MLSMIALVIAIAALVLASRATHKANEAAALVQSLRRRLQSMDRPDPLRTRSAPEPHAEPARAPAHGPAVSQPRPHAEAAPAAMVAPAPPAAPRSAVSRYIAARASGVPQVATSERGANQGDRPTGLEEKLGARLFVWIGGVALVLAGAFLVKYSFEQNLLSPGVRLALGTVLGVGLLAAGEWARTRADRVAQALVGAGGADLFAVLLAATRLYEYIGPTTGFLLMAILTAGAVALSLRHGQVVAILGLLGGFATPALIGPGASGPGALFAYLLLLEIGLVVVAGRRGWVGLSALTLVATMAWAAITGIFGSVEPTWAAGLIVASVAAYVAYAARATPAGAGPLKPFSVALAAATTGLLLLGTLAAIGGFGPGELVMLGILSVGCLGLAWLNPRYLPMACLSAGVGLVAIAASAWGGSLTDRHAAALLLGFGLLHAGAAYAAARGSGWPSVWGSLAAAAGFAYYVAALVVADDALPSRDAWAGAGLALAVAYAAGCVPYRSEPRTRAASALALASAGTLTVALALAFEHPWVAVAWAVAAVGVNEVRVRAGFDALRWAVGWLSGFAGFLALTLGPVAAEPGPLVVFNSLLPALGIPAAAFAVIAWRSRPERLREAHQALAVAGGLVAVTFLIRHAFHPGNLYAIDLTLFECATYAAAWLATGLAMERASRRWAVPALRDGALVAGTMGLVAAVGGAALWENPLWSGTPVGRWPLINALLPVYGMPCVLGALFAHAARRVARPVSVAAGGAALALLFTLVSLAVRQAFTGSVLTMASTPVGQAEWYTYSLAWLLLGVGLLAAGIWRQSDTLRYGSLVVVLLAVGKVFGLDAAQLGDLWRVLSFLGLGVSLIGLGYVYQRFVFTKKGTGARPVPEA